MNILVIEDEMTVAIRLIRFITEIRDKEQDRIYHVQDLDDAQDYLAENPVDLVTLDLNLNGQNGFDILKQMVAESFQTIIVSAHSDQAITAFEHGVLDFVPKPFRKDRLAQAFLKISQKDDNSKLPTRYVAVKTNTGIELLLSVDVVFIKAEGNYSSVHMNSGREYLHDKNLEKIAQILPSIFVRIHRSYIVNMLMIKSLKSYPGSRYEMILKNNQILPVSRQKIKKLKQIINI